MLCGVIRIATKLWMRSKRKPTTPYLVAPTVTQASVEASGMHSDVRQHKRRQRANFNKLVSNFQKAPRPVLANFDPERESAVGVDPALKVRRSCGTFHNCRLRLSSDREALC